MAKAYEYIIKVRGKADKTMDRISKAAGRSDSRFARLRKNVKGFARESRSLKSFLPGLGATLLATFSVAALMRYNSHIMDVTAEMEKYRAVLNNTFQSSQMGASSMAMIVDFASKTPFQVNELTESFVKLANRGLVPTENNMRQFGDVAASMGKGFDQFVEAALDAGTGEFERLKEFGIKAKSMGDNVSFSFKGQVTTVAKSEKAIQKYLQGLGDMKGVKGSMNAISQTLGGMTSNLQDKFAQMSYGIGEQLKPLYTAVFAKLGQAMDWINSKDFTPLINSFVNGAKWAYGAISGLFGFIQAHSDIFKGLLIGLGVIKAITLATSIYTGIQWLLNVAMTANPIGVIIVAVGALIGLFVHAYKKVEWFRGGIKAIGATIKHFGGLIKDYIINRFKGLLSGITGIGKALMHFFKGDWSKAWDAGKQGVLDLTGISAKKKFLEGAKKTGKVWQESYAKGAAEAKKNKATKSTSLFSDKAKAKNFDFEGDRTAYLAGAGGQKGGQKGGQNAKDGINGITGGGAKQTHINVSFGKFNETINVNTTNLKEGAGMVQAQFEEMFLRVMNSLNEMQTN